jgi:hypothetical protein
MKTKNVNLVKLIVAVLIFSSTFTTVEASQRVHVDKSVSAVGASDTVPVTWDTFVRAESDKMFKSYVDLGGFGKFAHILKPTPINQQKVIRMNRDTLYSIGIFDLSTPVTITKPDTGDRFQSMQVINQDEYTTMVIYKPGTYTLTKEQIGTRYVVTVFRTLVDSSDPADILKVNAIQHSITFKQDAVGKFEIPNWDQPSLDRLRDAINVLSATLKNAKLCFGTKEEVDPIAHLLGAAFGWGGNPAKDATYLNVVPDNNDGKTPHTLTVKDVPVDGFWSISLYNGKGYFQKNPANAYSINNIVAKKGNDGSITIHFGGDPKQPNYLAIMDGWNYVVRLYQPRKEILDGSWTFPEAQSVK